MALLNHRKEAYFAKFAGTANGVMDAALTNRSNKCNTSFFDRNLFIFMSCGIFMPLAPINVLDPVCLK
jgi:hypothetical protein